MAMNTEPELGVDGIVSVSSGVTIYTGADSVPWTAAFAPRTAKKSEPSVPVSRVVWPFGSESYSVVSFDAAITVAAVAVAEDVPAGGDVPLYTPVARSERVCWVGEAGFEGTNVLLEKVAVLLLGAEVPDAFVAVAVNVYGVLSR